MLVLAGVLATPLLIDVIAPGFHGAKRELTIRLVRILFPGAGLLVLSAWCLGILNSHRKFLLSYAAPVIWNVAMIATLLIFGRRMDLTTLAVLLAWGSVAGSALQFAVQLPVGAAAGPEAAARARHRVGARARPSCATSRRCSSAAAWCRSAPTSITLLASLLGAGAVAALTNAQTLYMLPVSLFGMAVSAAELPAMSSALGDRTECGAPAPRLNAGLRQIAFFVVPSAMAFLALGDVIAAALFCRPDASPAQDAMYVWGDPRRLGRRAARVDAGPALLVDLLRAARHAHAAALRVDPRRADDGLGLPVRVPAAPVARHRAAVGRRGPDRVGGLAGWVELRCCGAR